SLHGSDHLEEVRKALLAERAVAQELHQRCGLDVESFPHRFAAECDLLPEQVVLHEDCLNGIKVPRAAAWLANERRCPGGADLNSATPSWNQDPPPDNRRRLRKIW